MLPTPSTSHVSFKTIYEPAEDSFLLLDTLSSKTETTFLTNRFSRFKPPPLVVEVGTGSGVVISFLSANAKHIFGKEILALGVDVNIDACHATTKTVELANQEEGSDSVYLGSVRADLCSSFKQKSIDVLVFNPPYVPTADLPELKQLEHLEGSGKVFEREAHLLALSYAGGEDGMETTNHLLEQIPEVLTDRGIAYVLLCRQNKPKEVKERIPNWRSDEGSWNAETVGRSGKVAGWEKLEIIRIWRD